MDEAALVEALDSGKVWSAGLDVFEEEPKIHPGLLRNPKVMLVPHMGTWTVEVGACLSIVYQSIILCVFVGFLLTIYPPDTNRHGGMGDRERPSGTRNGQVEESGSRTGGFVRE